MSGNVPAIRFAGFTEPWEQRKLGELGEFNPKAMLPDYFEYVDLESVVGTEMIGHRRENRAMAPSRAQRIAQTGDIFYQTVRPYQRNNYLYELPDEDYVFSTGYAQIRPSIDSRFLFFLLQQDSFVADVLDRCTGTSYPAINADDLADIEVSAPADTEEQKLIGRSISFLENLITLHQRKHDQLATLKKSLLEKMFPKPGSDVPELRFAGFTEPWEQRKLGELVDDIATGKSVNSDDGIVGPGDVGIMKTSCVSYDTFDAGETKRVLPEEQSLVACPVEAKTLIVSRMNTPDRVGACGFVADDWPNLFLPDRLWRVRLRNSVEPYLVYLLLTSDASKEVLRGMASGTSGSMHNIPKESFLGMELALPTSLEEQSKIAKQFASLDNLITLHQRKHDQLATLKKSLLEKMFV